jgi:hypothetical protein
VSTPVLEPTAPDAVDQRLAKVAEFADRHPQIRHCIQQRVQNLMYVDPPLVTVHVLEAGWHDTLAALIVAARTDHIPVTVRTAGQLLIVELDFDGLMLIAVDYSTTTAADNHLSALAECTLARLNGVLADLAGYRKAGL